MILWLLFVFPFKDKLISWAHISSECGFLIYTLTLYTFLSDSMESNTRLFYGRIILWVLFLLIFINWILFIIYMINLFRKKRELKKKAKESANQLENEKGKLKRISIKEKKIRRKSLRMKKLEKKEKKKKRKKIKELDDVSKLDIIHEEKEEEIISNFDLEEFQEIKKDISIFQPYVIKN